MVFRLIVLCLFCISVQSFADELGPDCSLPESLCQLEKEFEASDAELNRVYKDIMHRIKVGELPKRALVDASDLKQSLTISQRSWLKFKEKNCDAFYVLNSGGMQRNEARLECEIEMANDRTQYLKMWY
ncbi:DUF1311 domain-containing protein (plasmid) [Vibrio coralliilyticus]|nr:DUF1311 domain-containing protein [Vibrio coralliilyticus]